MISSIRHLRYILGRCLQDVLRRWLSDLHLTHLLDICKMPWQEHFLVLIRHLIDSFCQLGTCLSGYMCGHKLTIKFPTDLHNYTGLNGPVNSFSQFTITTPPNELILGCKPHWSVKREKKTLCEKWWLGCVLQKSFPKYFSKFTERHLWGSLFLTLLKVFRPSGLQLY